MLRRWAISSRETLSRSIPALTAAWVSLSRALVASSKSSTAGFFASARAIRMRWRWPPETEPPPAESIVCIPIGISRMSCSQPARRAASHASSTVSLPEWPMILRSTVSGSSRLSCSTTPIRERSACRFTWLTSCPS